MKLREFEKYDKEESLKYDIPDSKQVITDTLKLLNNESVNVVIDEDYKACYYKIFNNSIYLSQDKMNQNTISKIILIVHECIHSVQSKVLHYLNFILSNLEMLLFLAWVIIYIINKSMNLPIAYVYLIITSLSISVRIYLEQDATFRSIKTAKEYLKEKINIDTKIIDEYEKLTKKNIILAMASTVSSKFVGLIACVVCLIFSI